MPYLNSISEKRADSADIGERLTVLNKSNPRAEQQLSISLDNFFIIGFLSKKNFVCFSSLT
jgi:hypothetical protein